MQKLGQSGGESPMLAFRVTEVTMGALKHAAKENVITVSEQARRWLEQSGKDYIRSEAARAEKRTGKKGGAR